MLMPTLLLAAALLVRAGAGGFPAAHDTTFWDDSWKRVSRRNAVYYGWTVPLDSGRCRILDFYLTGERQMEALGRSGPAVAKDGPATYYYRSGQRKAAGQYASGKRQGLWLYWQEDGSVKRQIQWRAGVAYAPVSVGSGSSPTATIPMLVEQMPKFPGPLSLGQYLAAATHRPPGPLPSGSREGKVYVEFVVGPQGNVTSAQIIKGFAPEYDAEVLRAVVAMPRWRPGQQNGEPVPVRMVIPITFR